uniref:transmembrane protein 17-like isoform X1 n=1 Tax=Myxine glutinosa TaxID=7769 RepID=UPI00358DFDF6
MAEASVEFPGLPRPGQRPGISSSAGPAEPSSPLPESLRRGLTALSESVFYRDRGGSSPETSALLSSLPLQMSLYFNTAFFPCWLSCHIAMLILKFPMLAPHNRFVAITVMLLITLIEATRLFLGWAGNLQEKLGELTGFWMLTLLLQLPLLLFLLLTPQPRALPLELAVHLVFAAFLTFQAVMGFRTIRSFSQNLSSHFLLHQFDSIPG